MSQEYLTGTGLTADADPVLQLLDSYEVVHGLRPDSDVQDSFQYGALQTLTFEPRPGALHPENWKVRRPALDIEVKLTARDELAIEVLPWTDRIRRDGVVWKYEDFITYPAPERPGQVPRTTAFVFPLEDLAVEVRNPGVLESDERAIVRRKLVFACYEFAIKRLSVPFECRVKTALVCVGPQAQLLLRKTTLPENPVERANLLEDARGIQWHTRFVRLCHEAGVTPEDLVSFHKRLLSGLALAEQDKTLREFLGKPPKPEESPRYGYSRRRRQQNIEVGNLTPLLDALHVVAHPKEFPPLREGGSVAAKRFIAHLLGRTGHTGIRTLSATYQFEEDEMRSFMRRQYPELFFRALPLRELVWEFEVLFSTGEEGANLARPFHGTLLVALQQQWGEDVEGTYSKRMSALVRRSGFDSQTDLLLWLQRNVPTVAEWLTSLKPKKQAGTPK